MFCRKCGVQNDDTAIKCAACGEPLGPAVAPRIASAKLANHLVWAILATIFCCLPFGIVAIVYAAQVDGKVAAGDYAGAVETSKKAKTWCWVSFAVGLVGGLIYAGLIFFGVVSGVLFD